MLLLTINMAMAQQEDLKPVLYGQAFNGLNKVDGALITVYPFADDTDVLTDIVGLGGNTKLSTYWKVNLNKLETDLQDNDVVVISLADNGDESLLHFSVDFSQATHFITLNLDPSYNDYDDDGYTADVDCDDNNADINPGVTELVDGVDNNCDGNIDEGTNAYDDDGDDFTENEGDCNDADDTIYPSAFDECGDGIDQDCSGADAVCGEEHATVEIFSRWTLFSLELNPSGIQNTQQLGNAIMAQGTTCDVILSYDAESQDWSDDILSLNDPPFLLTSTDGYYIFCDLPINFTYVGEPW